MTTASVIGGKTLRACDSCVCRRARWYCASDDAFLCQSCDSSVHSANPLARRHHRVRLQTSSTIINKSDWNLAPTWHHGFKRKARTPRPSPKVKNSGGTVSSTSSLVPEIETSGGDEGSNEEEEQLLYRVPIFDPVLAEFYSPTPVDECNSSEVKPSAHFSNSHTNSNSDSDGLSGFLQSDTELAEFAADMERLLGHGFENDSFSMEELGLVDAKYEQVKEEIVENENDTVADHDVKIYEEIDLSRETLEINFDCRSGSDESQAMDDQYEEGKTKIGLRLDYEAVSVEWSAHGCLSPWMNGERPQLGPDDCWLNYMSMWGVKDVQGVVGGEVGGVHIDEEREARVSRYREKRRTRLFSKKIRYQVRKLNAEKRPRMKGRFVKRASF